MYHGILCCCPWGILQKQKNMKKQKLFRPPTLHDGDGDLTKRWWVEYAYRDPPQIYRPQTWFHYIGGNVSKAGITADLAAIAKTGISGIQLFHGQFGGPWPGVEPQIACLSPMWEDAVKHTAQECRRLGLRFTMQNCPGWAMSGGPWIEPSKAMRHLVWSRTDIDGGSTIGITLPVPQPSIEPWRDYKAITVLAFPTPMDDTDTPLRPNLVNSNLQNLDWIDCLAGNLKKSFTLPPAPEGKPNWIEVTFPDEMYRLMENRYVPYGLHPTAWILPVPLNREPTP